MKFVIITGMSGAGKSQAVDCFEDMGYYCIDNMPSELFAKFAEMCYQAESRFDKVAFVIDTRSSKMFSDIFKGIDELEKFGDSYDILFLDCDDDTIVKRYKETRRSHPLSPDGRIIDGIEKERKILEQIKYKAKYVINTSQMLPRDLKERIEEIFSDNEEEKRINVNVVSFGFKYGIPLDSDLVFDVRFLPNPYYIPELKHKTGLDKEVRDYVNKFKQTQAFAQKLDDMISFLMPCYVEEGKTQLVISVGCTGGKHRSVTLAVHVSELLIKLGYKVRLIHRDINKGK